MSHVQLGPLSLPAAFLLTVASAALGLFIGRRLGRERAADAEALLLKALLVAVVAARLAFVWQFREAYLARPWDILDIRDGGWEPQVGAIAGWLAALLWLRPRGSLRRPVIAAMGGATALWVAGSVGLAVQSHQQAQLPDWSFAGLDGEAVALRSFEGRPTVVNLWATWCGPCRREMPVLQQAQAAHPGVHFVFLNQGESADKVKRFLGSEQLRLHNVLLDAKGRASTLAGHRSLPTTLFFDAQGRLVGSRVGELSRATLGQRLAPLLAGDAR
ncbi:TlpA disulfide reductase family protein [Aquincola sp. MAHUQ-54]|uniref:TlpA disulfide reductase family protein n=1 Tax=Aquincola agrisoli TaxID=3119538 RepID=A0AAW9QGF9_9BURK